MIVNYQWVLKDLFGYKDEEIANMSDEECRSKFIELSSEDVKCETCDKEVEKEKAWTLCGRDYEAPAYFCSDSCRMMFPFKKQ